MTSFSNKFSWILRETVEFTEIRHWHSINEMVNNYYFRFYLFCVSRERESTRNSYSTVSFILRTLWRIGWILYQSLFPYPSLRYFVSLTEIMHRGVEPQRMNGDAFLLRIFQYTELISDWNFKTRYSSLISFRRGDECDDNLFPLSNTWKA